MRESLRILLVNAHWNNRGDEAALCSLVDELLLEEGKGELVELKICVIFKETSFIVDWPYPGKVEYTITKYLPSENEVLQALSSGYSDNSEMRKEIGLIDLADIVIYTPGGAVISDRFWWEKQLEYIFPIAYAQKKGKKTVFAAPSVGPFSENHLLRKTLFERTDAVCLRESIGLRAIRAFTGDLGNITLSCDLAFLSEVDRESADKILQSDADLTAFLRRFEKIVGITVTDLSWNVGFLGDKSVKRTIEDSFSTFIEWLDTQDIGVVLIPQLFGGQNDRDYLSRFIRDNCLLLSDRYNCNFQQYLISRLYAVVGVRYHCNIFAAKMGIPMIPIVYEQKMKGFLQDSKLESWGLDVYDISGEKIILYFMTLCSEYINRKEYLQKHAKIWKKNARNTIDVIVQIACDQI